VGNGLQEKPIIIGWCLSGVGQTAFAGKPAPTRICGAHSIQAIPRNLWERACPRRGPISHHKTRRQKKPHPAQHRTGLSVTRNLPQGFVVFTQSKPSPETCGSGLAREEARSATTKSAGKKSPAWRRAGRGFDDSGSALTRLSWSCAYQSNAAPHPDRPGWRYPPGHRIRR